MEDETPVIATSLVNPSFAGGFSHAVNWPTLVAVIAAGALSGCAIGFSHRNAHTTIAPGLVVLLSSSLLVAMQAAVLFGLSVTTPANTAAYTGNHLALALLSILCGASAGPGVWLAQQRVRRARGDVGKQR